MITKHVKDKWLKPAQQKVAEELLLMWGMWEFSGLDSDKRVNMIYRFMKSAEGVETLFQREVCNDEFGTLANELFTVHTKRNPVLRDILIQRYWFGRSVNNIAMYYRNHSDDRKCVRVWNDVVKMKLREFEKIFFDSLQNRLSANKNAKYLKKYQNLLAFCANEV